ncbi:uncharacterized protein LOC107044440 [Diachasma alloeum]|uniref:uncharacterized protein LOC107044440 n=1 Tax=Diachasma alloeum TaxID=454923 RepID=UPI00073834DC|nr:uncharacterized protein LOC107044440 [Diachasma alloeum]
MVFKYRLISNSKILRRNGYLNCAKKIAILFAALGLIWIALLQVRLWNLSKLKPMTEAFRDEWDREIKILTIEDESRDSWRTPGVENWRIFSAYLETRPEVVLEEDDKLIYSGSAWGFVRIIGIVPVSAVATQLTCSFRYPSANHTSYILKKPSIRTELVAFGENFEMYYCAAYILCPLPHPNEAHPANIRLPAAVTVSTTPDRPIDTPDPSEFVAIRYPKAEDNRRLFSVCVQPFHHQFDKADDLIAFIEYYRMMGVDRFTFYRDSVAPRVDQVLEYYSHLNAAVVLQWKLADLYEFERNLRVDGIYAALNDCLYRSTSFAGYRYVLGVDVDEYVMPRRHDNFSEMMEYLNHEGGTVGAWIFRNAFYYLMYDDDAVTLSPGIPKINFHSKTRRWEKVNPPHDRSKFIAQGRDVIELGNHRIWRMKRTWSLFRRYKEAAVDPDVGTSNHYRFCETEIETCWQRKTTIDRTAHRFSQELGRRVENVFRTVFGANDG